jgi:CxxC motif-containing protein
MEVIKQVTVKAPVKRYDVIIENVCDTGVDIVATKDI